jgi:ABC-2 type transport system ATP-binding protein
VIDSKPVIDINKLSKVYKVKEKENGTLGFLKSFINPRYDLKQAVNTISFKIFPGDIVGYIGHNGAGKSTTIKMLCGVLTPSNGSIFVNGKVPHLNRQKNARDIGVMFGQRCQLWWDIPLIDSFKILKSIYRVSDQDFEDNMTFFKEMLDIEKILNIPVRNLSLGQRMCGELCASMLHNPKVLFLDEPTIGLDLFVKEKFRSTIKEINRKRNTTIVLTTHDISEIEKLCDRIIIIDTGDIIYDGDYNELRDSMKLNEKIIIDTFDRIEADLVRGLIDRTNVSVGEKKITLEYDPGSISSISILEKISEVNKIKDFKIIENNLEQYILEIYKNGKV